MVVNDYELWDVCVRRHRALAAHVKARESAEAEYAAQVKRFNSGFFCRHFNAGC